MRNILNASIFLLAFTITFAVGVNAYASYSGIPLPLTATEQALRASGNYLATDGMNIPVQGILPQSYRNMTNLVSKTATTNLVWPMAVAETAGARVSLKMLSTSALKVVPVIGYLSTGYMTYAAIRDIVKGSPSTYPQLGAAVNDAPHNSYTIGSTIYVAGYGAYQITGLKATWTQTVGTYNPATNPIMAAGYIQYYYNMDSNGLFKSSDHYWVSPIDNPTSPPDANVTGDLGGGSGLTQGQTNELVDMAKANPSKVSFPDAALAAAAVQSQIDAEQAQNLANKLANYQDAKTKYDTLCASNPGSDYCAKAKEMAAAIESTKAEQLKLSQDQAATKAEDNLQPPPLPPDNVYDPTITPPEKKSILQLLTDWASASPLAGMISSFTVNTTSPFNYVSCGTVYGREIKFEFARYTDVFQICGGILLAVAHGLAVLWVVRGGAA